jgi:hypothetical protein
MAEFKIPAINWPTHLAEAIRLAEPGDRVIVRTEPMRLLAESAAERMGKDGIDIEIAEVLDD